MLKSELIELLCNIEEDFEVFFDTSSQNRKSTIFLPIDDVDIADLSLDNGDVFSVLLISSVSKLQNKDCIYNLMVN